MFVLIAAGSLISFFLYPISSKFLDWFPSQVAQDERQLLSGFTLGPVYGKYVLLWNGHNYTWSVTN